MTVKQRRLPPVDAPVSLIVMPLWTSQRPRGGHIVVAAVDEAPLFVIVDGGHPFRQDRMREVGEADALPVDGDLDVVRVCVAVVDGQRLPEVILVAVRRSVVSRHRFAAGESTV